jgi:hypothetical protein
MIDEPGSQRAQEIAQKGEKESLDEGGDGQEFSAPFPGQETGALESEFGFAIADRDLDLPTAVVAQDDAPGIRSGANGLIGDQIPGFTAFARPRDDQGKWEKGKIRDADRQKNDPGLALTAPAGIIDHAVIQTNVSHANTPRP